MMTSDNVSLGPVSANALNILNSSWTAAVDTTNSTATEMMGCLNGSVGHVGGAGLQNTLMDVLQEATRHRVSASEEYFK